ncbi:hypothetical protein HDU97_004088 [Phlyctochytrium planicorne]|nr:hypothetical protein HDU97_004088 [Phlyctochytrium planicorne]
MATTGPLESNYGVVFNMYPTDDSYIQSPFTLPDCPTESQFLNPCQTQDYQKASKLCTAFNTCTSFVCGTQKETETRKCVLYNTTLKLRSEEASETIYKDSIQAFIKVYTKFYANGEPKQLIGFETFSGPKYTAPKPKEFPKVAIGFIVVAGLAVIVAGMAVVGFYVRRRANQKALEGQDAAAGMPNENIELGDMSSSTRA